MVQGDSELRAELSRLTNPPNDVVGLDRVEKWLENQFQEISKLNERRSHSITVDTPWSAEISKTNCYMYALDLPPKDIEEWRYLEIQPDTPFVCHLLKA